MSAHRLVSTTCSLASLQSGRFFSQHRRCLSPACGCPCHVPPVAVSDPGAGEPSESDAGADRSSQPFDAAEPSSAVGSNP